MLLAINVDEAEVYQVIFILYICSNPKLGYNLKLITK